ncbi:MAG TPA: glycosyl hydrolase family 8 [Opitutaceae bacterium]|nr:glycosyl hydrolase family 8 [Opitutaceae bacterium]
MNSRASKSAIGLGCGHVRRAMLATLIATLAWSPVADGRVRDAAETGAREGSRPAIGAAASGDYRNLFREYLGKSDADVKAKLDGAWHQLVEGDPDSQRLYYPVAGDMAYVPDIANHDVRTEGLSYMMMIAVQLDHQREFNAIWKFAKHYMGYDAGPFRGYFAWHTAFDGRRLSPGPAPDGEEWFTMALFFASHRWGDGKGIYNYGAEAQQILHAMLHKSEEPGHGPIGDMFDRTAKEIVFVPQGPGAHFTDPSYHLPMFYELWARWASDPQDRAFLAQVTQRSQELYVQAANPKTGLMPDYAQFDGQPYRSPWGNHQDFLYDAWRTLAYPALDYTWWAADPREMAQSNRVLTFLAAQGPRCPDRFTLDGTPISADVNSPGVTAMAAVAALAADRAIGEPFVRRLWEQKLPEGRNRYYGGLLTVLGLLEVSGNFRVYAPTGSR